MKVSLYHWIKFYPNTDEEGETVNEANYCHVAINSSVAPLVCIVVNLLFLNYTIFTY